MYQIHQHDEGMIVDLTECIKRMDRLMADLTSNQKLRPIIDDNEGDVALWNKVNFFFSHPNYAGPFSRVLMIFVFDSLRCNRKSRNTSVAKVCVYKFHNRSP